MFVDMFICICNVQMVFKIDVMMLFLKMKIFVVQVLKDEGYVEDFFVLVDVKFELMIILKYFGGKLVIEEIKWVSCLSLCQYNGVGELLKVFGGLGVVIVLMFKGVMIDCVV